MAALGPRTEFLRRLVASRPLGPDGYVEDLVKLERALANRGAMGVASGLAFGHLLSRYPREYEAIRKELGGPLADSRPAGERIALLVEERLRLAEVRADAAGTFL